MARGMGLEPRDAVGVFERLIPGVHARAARMVKGDFTPSFELTMARKDLRLALEAANRSGLPLAVLPAMAKRFDDVLAAGHGAEDYSVIAAESLAEPRASAHDGDDPFAQLERCHRRLEERLAAFARAPGDADERAKLFDFLGRSIRRHEDDEEASLFPRLAAATELAPVIASLRKEHEIQNERQRALREAKGEEETVRALRALDEGYRAHIQEEEKTLFPAARRLLDAEGTRGLAREMQARRGHEGEGRGGRGRGGGGGGGGGRGR
jgi:hemerythrin-like domain-containing protein